MKTIKVTVNTGLVGSRREETFEVEDDVSDEEIEEIARDVMFNMIEWGYETTND